MSVSSLTAIPTRSLSRPSSRVSVHSARAASPALLSADDPVAVRNHISTLKHSIRHQQAQLHNLENIVLRGPRPYPAGIMPSPSSSMVDLTSPPLTDSATGPSSFPHGQPGSSSIRESNPLSSSSTSPSTSPAKAMRRRSSFDILHNIAPDSNLPLPKRERDSMSVSVKSDVGIREGVPMEFGVSQTNLGHHKRVSSPTRTYSRIPVSSVGNARALADEGTFGTLSPTPSTSHTRSPNRASLSLPPTPLSPTPHSLPNGTTSNPPSATLTPTSANKRLSLTPGGTTKVLADLQTGVINARNALENTKAQLRVSQRSVAQLTRQTEDLKEGRERLRLENEGLNNVVARKERLLQEVLERARKAETEAASLKTQLKSETTANKKSIRDMEHALSESTALSQKSEREYITLRDALKTLTESWKLDTERLREEMTRREEKVKAEAESMGRRYKRLVEEIKSAKEGGAGESIISLREEDARVRSKIEEAFREEIGVLRKEMDKVAGDGEEANQTAKMLAAELARLRRMMQAAGRQSVSNP